MSLFKKDGEYKYDEVLIDGDLLAFSSCCAIEYNAEDPEDIDFQDVLNNIMHRIVMIQRRVRAKKARIFLTGKNNFRKVIDDRYKANRKDVQPPKTLASAKQALVDMYNAEMIDGLEADDLMAMNQTDKTIIATLDKDLMQVPGAHYRWESQHKGEKLTKVDNFGFLNLTDRAKGKVEGGGSKFFCYQLLIGDATDNVIGCGIKTTAVYKSGAKAGQEYTRRKGVGAVAAFDLLDECTDYKSCMQAVIREYKDVFGPDWEEALLTAGRCVYMSRRMEGQLVKLWHFRESADWFNLEKFEVVKLEG